MAKGKNLNPADAFRKTQRKKELKKNKESRSKARDFALVKKDTRDDEEELEKLQAKAEPSKAERDRIQELKSELEAINKKKEEYVAEHPEHRHLVYKRRKVAKNGSEDEEELVLPKERNLFKKNGLPRHPERSIYYDPVMNPFGVAPPGMPYIERPLRPDEVSSDQEADGKDSDDDIAMPEGPPPAEEDEAEDDSDDDIPMPEGPPPPRSEHQPPLPPGPSLLPPFPPPLPMHILPPNFVSPPPLPYITNHSLPLRPFSVPSHIPSLYPPPPPGFQTGSFLPSPPPGLPQPPFPPPPPGFVSQGLPPHPPFLPTPPHHLPPPPPGFFPRHQSSGSLQDPLSSIPHQTFQAHRASKISTQVTPKPQTPTISANATAATSSSGASISAAAELRDFKKESTAFVPSSLKRKKPGGARSGSSSTSINAAPLVGVAEEAIAGPARPDLVSSLMGQFGPGKDVKESKEKGGGKGKDDYAKFMDDLGDILGPGAK
ncbi:hypothetical protein JAAARDRAFT_29143 [Jaapia argillacea MUCL 33604]|uniref:Wbp11/ELF5/Saf1 N-terminal domain-containing protein n=1 Tax=Jaapia argillacea MUCL 33604 TaxID=933084 RepID=A0A067QHZ6_9AGAM|nr:hypothetical protein JAAARDRAFT_29143 [Jaapia argillacea MUCL 33604]